MIRFACFAALCAALTASTSAQGIARRDGTTVLAPSQAMAEGVLAEALAIRQRAAQQWLGRQRTASQLDTTINVIFSEKLHETTRSVEGPQGRFYRVALWTDAQQATGAGLQRAMVKLVLAADANVGLPDWAIVGAANLISDPNRSRQNDQIISWFQRTGNWPDLAQLLMEKKVGRYDRAGIAMSASLTSFLLTRADHATFLKFAANGQDNWDVALRTYYRIDDVEQLQGQWRSWTERQGEVDQTARSIQTHPEIQE